MEKYGATDRDIIEGLQTESLNILEQIKDVKREINAVMASDEKTAAKKKSLQSLERRLASIRSTIDSFRSK